MKLMKTLGLLVIFAALAAYVYFYEIKGGEEREKIKELEEQLFNFEPDSVESIKISSFSNTFYFERKDGTWIILKPVETGADNSNIDGLLNTLKNLKKDRELKIKKEDLRSYGLSGKPLQVNLFFNNDGMDSIRFGINTPVGSNTYVNKIDTVVYTVPQNTRNSVSKSLFDWRDKSVAKVKQNEINEFKLKNKNGKFHFLKEGSDWMLKSPIETNADNSSVNSILSKMEYGRVKEVVSESLDKPRVYRLDKPDYEIDLYLGEGKAHKRIIFSSLEKNRANGKDDSRPHIFTVDSTFIKDINKTLFQLRDKKFAQFEQNSADKVVVTQGDSLITFVKDTSGTWMHNDSLKLKEWKMNSFLSSLNNLQVKKFLQENISKPTKYGLATPGRIIEIFRGEEKIQQVSFGNKKENFVIAFSPFSQIVAEIDESAFNNLEVKTDEFVEEVKTEELDNS